MASSENEQVISFQEFYHTWKDEQTHHLHSLITASRAEKPTDPSLSHLVEQVVCHYEKYYTVKAKLAQNDVLLLLSPPWTTTLEDAHLWVGGWRPSTAFHLIYSKSGIQFEARLLDLINGVETGDLAGLPASQLGSIDNLQRTTIREERAITEKAAKQQGKVADMEMVELSHVMSDEPSRGGGAERVDSVLDLKEEGFQVILRSADELRMRTIKDVVRILSPIQAVHFLIAAAELQLRLHDWGKEKEERRYSEAN